MADNSCKVKLPLGKQPESTSRVLSHWRPKDTDSGSDESDNATGVCTTPAGDNNNHFNTTCSHSFDANYEYILHMSDI